MLYPKVLRLHRVSPISGPKVYMLIVAGQSERVMFLSTWPFEGQRRPHCTELACAGRTSITEQERFGNRRIWGVCMPYREEATRLNYFELPIRYNKLVEEIILATWDLRPFLER